jgi:hypothetical protein
MNRELTAVVDQETKGLCIEDGQHEIPFGYELELAKTGAV